MDEKGVSPPAAVAPSGDADSPELASRVDDADAANAHAAAAGAPPPPATATGRDEDEEQVEAPPPASTSADAVRLALTASDALTYFSAELRALEALEAAAEAEAAAARALAAEAQSEVLAVDALSSLSVTEGVAVALASAAGLGPPPRDAAPLVAEGATPWLEYGAASTIGWRPSQEDALALHPDFHASSDASPRALFAVFDGHGGRETAAFAAAHVAGAVAAELTAVALVGGSGAPDAAAADAAAADAAALRRALQRLDGMLLQERWRPELAALSAAPVEARHYGLQDAQGDYFGPSAGATATLALVSPAHAAIANLGDSRAVLITRDGRAVRPLPAARLASVARRRRGAAAPSLPPPLMHRLYLQLNAHPGAGDARPQGHRPGGGGAHRRRRRLRAGGPAVRRPRRRARAGRLRVQAAAGGRRLRRVWRRRGGSGRGGGCGGGGGGAAGGGRRRQQRHHDGA